MKALITVMKKAVAFDRETTKVSNELVPSRRLGLIMCHVLGAVEAKNNTSRALHVYALTLQVANLSNSACLVASVACTIDSSIVWRNGGLKALAKYQLLGTAKGTAIVLAAITITQVVESNQK